MLSLRPRRQFNFVGAWKAGFILSACLMLIAAAGLGFSYAKTGSAVTLGTEFSGGTSIELSNTSTITEDEVTEAFDAAVEAVEAEEDITVSSVQASVNSTTGENGFILKTTCADSVVMNEVVTEMVDALELNINNAQVETIGASWGSSVVRSSIFAFILACFCILLVITFRYREPRMGVVALITLFHDLFIIVGLYAWGGLYLNLEVTSDVIAALLAIVGYSLYDTIVVFHRINKNASPQMKQSLRACANRSMNEVIVRSINTSITSVVPVLLMLILGTDTLRDFAVAMFAGMIIGCYSTIVISAPIFTLWKMREPKYARLEKKYAYAVEQPKFTAAMNKEAKKAEAAAKKEAKFEAAKEKALAAAKK